MIAGCSSRFTGDVTAEATWKGLVDTLYSTQCIGCDGKLWILPHGLDAFQPAKLGEKKHQRKKKSIQIPFSCGRTSTHTGHQHTARPVCWSTQLGAPVKSPPGSAGPDTDVLRETDKWTSQPLWTHPVRPTKLTQKCPETQASPLEGCLTPSQAQCRSAVHPRYLCWSISSLWLLCHIAPLCFSVALPPSCLCSARLIIVLIQTVIVQSRKPGSADRCLVRPSVSLRSHLNPFSHSD